MLFFTHQETSLLTVSPSQQHEAIERLIGATTLRGGYYLLLVLSTLIVSSGLLMNSPAVVIGGMVIAPLLLPILALSLSLVARSVRGILHALTVLSVSIVITVLLSYGIMRVAAMMHLEIVWMPENISPILYFLVAFCSGIVAAFALVKEDIATAIAGIAISVSLLPPLCGIGLAVALGDIALASSTLDIFLLNVVGILLAAVLAFVLLGFVRAAKATEKIVKEATQE